MVLGGLGRVGQRRGPREVLGIAAAVCACLSQSSLLLPDLLLCLSLGFLPSFLLPFLLPLSLYPLFPAFSGQVLCSLLSTQLPSFLIPILSLFSVSSASLSLVALLLVSLAHSVRRAAVSWGPCPPHSWGGRLCPLPVLVLLLQGTLGGSGELRWPHQAHL